MFKKTNLTSVCDGGLCEAFYSFVVLCSRAAISEGKKELCIDDVLLHAYSAVTVPLATMYVL